MVGLPDCASIARIRRPHGVKGELLIESLTDEPDALLAPGRRVFRGTAEGELWLDPETKSPRELSVVGIRPFKGEWLLTLDAITDRTEAERWNGRLLMVPVGELSAPDEGSVFEHELDGMMLIDADSGEEIGPVVAHYTVPQGLLLEFRAGAGLASLPFVEEFVEEVQRDERRIRVRLPDGLLEA